MDPQALERAAARRRAGEIGDAAYAGLYFLRWQAGLHGVRCASRRRRADPRPDPAAWLAAADALAGPALDAHLHACFERHQFLGVTDTVPRALAAWLGGEWPLTLCPHIPRPAEVLEMQVAGTRPVTVLAGWPRMLAPVLAKANAFAFMVHDLEHAFKFYHDPGLHLEQREFFRALLACLKTGRFDAYLADPVFAAKFDYVSSDMNTHPFHAALYLRAVLLEFHLRREGLARQYELAPSILGEVSALLAGLVGEDCVAAMERRVAGAGA